MVKLVPVLLVSSAFVQMMIIETELPQVVQEAIAQNNEKPTARILLEVSRTAGFKIRIQENGQESTVEVPVENQQLNLAQLHQKLVTVKSKYPQVFKLELVPRMGKLSPTNCSSQKKTIKNVIKRAINLSLLQAHIS
jgi:hypothetical protein